MPSSEGFNKFRVNPQAVLYCALFSSRHWEFGARGFQGVRLSGFMACRSNVEELGAPDAGRYTEVHDRRDYCLKLKKN